MKIHIRQATVDDIPQMVEIDSQAWWEGVAFNELQFQSQIARYPEGIFVAEVLENERKRMVGITCGLRITSSFAEKIHNWREATGNGYFTPHDPNGDVGFGANLSVLPEFERMGIGDKLFGRGAAVLVRDNMRYLLLGGRLPGLAHFNKERVEQKLSRISGEEYALLRDDKGRVLDDELRFYLRQPFLEIVRIIPNYFPDPESENYGVLLKWHNPLYKLHLGWIYRIPVLGKLVAHIVAVIIPLVI